MTEPEINHRNESLYSNKLILAPMVRVGTLPMRLLALQYGADLVYCEEIIDRKILMCERQENELLGTTDFVLSDGTIVFRTCPQEKEKLIFQIGTSDPNRALAAAKRIQDCVAGVDVNMGCPKEFSLKGGMGAALITNPDKVKAILTTLVKGLSVPVTCKIRVLPELEDTIQLVKIIQDTGVSAIAVHGRTKTERPGDANRNHYIRAVAETVHIPVIANGGSRVINTKQDLLTFRSSTGTSSVMVARAAEWNCSVFREQGMLPITDVIQEYLRYAFCWDNVETNTKYCVLQMLHDKMTEMPEGDKCLAAKSNQDFATIWKMQDEFAEILRKRKERGDYLASLHSNGENHGVKRRKLENGNIYIELPVRYDKRCYSSTLTPKQVLNNWLVHQRLGKAVYHTTERAEDRQFNSQVTLEGKTYGNPYWEKSKPVAEQSAAIACLVANGQDDGRRKDLADSTREELHRKWVHLLSEKDILETDNNNHCNRESQAQENTSSKSVEHESVADLTLKDTSEVR